MQSLPLELWQRIFCSFQSDAVSVKSCVNLALTCKTCREAFATSRQESCKKAVLRRLLRWTAVNNGVSDASPYSSSGDKGKATIHVRATLSCRKSLRLLHWLETGIITVSEFWGAQDLCRPVIEGVDGDTERVLLLVLVEKFPKDQVLDRKTKKALMQWMLEFATLAKAQYKSVEVYHDASNGQREWLYSDKYKQLTD